MIRGLAEYRVLGIDWCSEPHAEHQSPAGEPIDGHG